MLHEVADQRKFLKEINNLLECNGKVLIDEAKGHVSKKNFKKSVKLSQKEGFKTIKGTKNIL